MTVNKTVTQGEDPGPQTAIPAAPVAPVAPAAPVSPARWLHAVIRTTRPRQWPKNLLVFAAPLAGASLGRDDGLGYALLAMLAFIFKEAWPSFSHNGLSWFGTGGNADQQIQAIFTSGDF